ncbi:hypothetical protein GRAN_3757 [Granulicella sibirica]|uniref:Uncharacterized protein n=1 Tax=Granulicella sibirica TaxID=2479048 RepID=A0A4Q0SUD7_9BACT|nr:hypothetical protein GRAN_3757 [Granulicella sibirica]
MLAGCGHVSPRSLSAGRFGIAGAPLRGVADCSAVEWPR